MGLRNAMSQGKPLIYFHGISKGLFLASWPVYIVGDNPGALTFTVAVDEKRDISFEIEAGTAEPSTDLRRRYLTAATKVRLHQKAFRERVLTAYQKRCAMCQLKHTELLEAAHIIADSHEGGLPLVSKSPSTNSH